MSNEASLESLKKYISENKLREKYSQMKYDVAGIKFLAPEVYPYCLEVGMRINVQEASRIIGHATITRIFNEILAKKS